MQGLLESTAWPDVRGRSAHSVAPDTVAFTHSSPAASSSDAEDSMNTDEDWESEIDFWGGESPRSRLTSPNLDQMAIDNDSEADGDDSMDEYMSDDADDDDADEDDADEDDADEDDADEDDADEYNRIDIIGHR